MATAGTLQGLRIGRVIETTLDVIYRDARVLLPMALLCVAAPAALLAVLELSLGGPDLRFVQSLVFQTLLQGAVMHTVASNLNHRPRSLNAGLRKGAELFLPLLGMAVLAAVGIVLGLALLVIPGVILACMWAVAAPARVTEGPGVMRAFGRSRALTKGFRWQIVLLALVYVAALLALGLGLGMLGLLGPWFTQVVLSPILDSLASLVLSAGAAALYYELRRAKEGVGPEALAAVFD